MAEVAIIAGVKRAVTIAPTRSGQYKNSQNPEHKRQNKAHDETLGYAIRNQGLDFMA